jgi:hypothetical protein
MNKAIIALLAISLIPLSSCTKKTAPKSQPTVISSCPKITPKNRPVTCPKVTDFQQNKDGWALNVNSPRNWNITRKFLMPKPTVFKYAAFLGTTEGAVTCVYQGADSNNPNDTSSMWVQVQYKPQVLKPCAHKWSQKKSNCVPTTTAINNVTQCAFNRKS